MALTGRDPFRTGLISNSSGGAIQPGKEVMLPTIMKKAGYVTASVGKARGQMSYGPGEWGFDEYLVFPRQRQVLAYEQTPSYHLNGQEKDLPEACLLFPT